MSHIGAQGPRRAITKRYRICAYCGSMFYPKSNAAKYCSPQCARAVKTGYAYTTPDGRCRNCGMALASDELAGGLCYICRTLSKAGRAEYKSSGRIFRRRCPTCGSLCNDYRCPKCRVRTVRDVDK